MLRSIAYARISFWDSHFNDFDGTLLTLAGGLSLSSNYAALPMRVKADELINDFIKDDPTSTFAGLCSRKLICKFL
jgi:hypothetical protein